MLLSGNSKILILALSGIGDALMFTPSIKLIRKALPEAQIDALVMFRGAKEILERNRNLNNVYHFDFIKRGAPASLKFLLTIRYKYDATINVYPSNRKEYNIINFLIGAEKRAAVRYLRKDSQNFGALNNVRITENDNMHNVITNIRLCEKLLGTKFNEEPELEFPLTLEDEIYSAAFLNQLKISNDELVIGFHPGCAVLKNHIKRRWEPEKFAQLGRKIINEFGAKILIFGGPDEESLKETIRLLIESPDAYNVTTNHLSETAAIMKRCNLFVTNDSSLMHVAAAMKLNTVVIIGPTNQKYIYPWNTEHKIISLNLDCSPCFVYSPRPLICFRDDVKFKCIKELTVNMVYDAVTEFVVKK